MKKALSTVVALWLLSTALLGCEKVPLEDFHHTSEGEESQSEVNTVSQNGIPLPENLPAPLETYEDILDRCSRLAELKNLNVDVTKYFYEHYDHTNEIERAIYQSVLYLDTERLGYIRRDFNDQGGEELALIDFDGQLGAVFTTVDEELRLVGCYAGQRNPSAELLNLYGTFVIALKGFDGDGFWYRSILNIQRDGSLGRNAFGCCTIDGKIEYYREYTDGKRVAIDLAEVDRLLDNYGWSQVESLHSLYAAKAEVWLATDKLLSRMDEPFRAVLTGKETILFGNDVNGCFLNCSFLNYTTYAYFEDMDGDGKKEALVCCEGKGSLVLRQTEQGIRGYHLEFPFASLTSDGKLILSDGGMSVEGYRYVEEECAARFDGERMVLEALRRIESFAGEERYFIGGEEVDRDAYIGSPSHGKPDYTDSGMILWSAMSGK